MGVRLIANESKMEGRNIIYLLSLAAEELLARERQKRMLAQEAFGENMDAEHEFLFSNENGTEKI